MLILSTIFPFRSSTVAWGGICSSRPGRRGEFNTTSFCVGNGTVIAWAISNTGIQIV